MSIKESVINEILELHNQINQYTDLSDAIEKITNVAIKACNADAGFFFKSVSEHQLISAAVRPFHMPQIIMRMLLESIEL